MPPPFPHGYLQMIQHTVHSSIPQNVVHEVPASKLLENLFQKSKIWGLIYGIRLSGKGTDAFTDILGPSYHMKVGWPQP